MADSKITDLAAIASVAGTEEFVVNDSGNDKKATSAQVYAYIKATIEALSDAGAIQDADSVVLLDNSDSDTLHPSTVTNLSTYVINKLMASTAETTGANADKFPFYDDDEGATNTMTFEKFADFILADVEPQILDISDKTAKATPVDADLFLNCDGTTPKKTTFAQLKATILAGFDTYMNALATVPSTNNTDVFYCTQSGTEKKVTLLDIVNHINYPINGSGSAGYLADWSDADTLQNTYSVTTSFGTGTNTSIATDKGVRDEMDTIINDATAMAAAIVDADTILIDDGAAGTQRKATFTQLITWLSTAGLTFNGFTLADAGDIVANTTTGSKIGTAVGQKLGFWNATPVVQPASADQADQGAMTGVAVGDLVATNGGWGYSSEANADKVHTAIDQLVADVTALDTIVTAIRTALVDTGIMKGAA